MTEFLQEYSFSVNPFLTPSTVIITSFKNSLFTNTHTHTHYGLSILISFTEQGSADTVRLVVILMLKNFGGGRERPP